MAWLACSGQKCDRDAHSIKKMSKSAEVDDVQFLSRAERVKGRQWLMDHGYADLLALERKLRPGEEDEPEGIL